MPYFIASIMAVTSAIVILFSRYEADESAIMAKIDKMKVMITMVDGFVNTYIESGGVLSDINFEELQESSILLENSTVTGTALESTMKLPNDNVVWHIIPNKDYSNSYKLLVDMSGDSSLMSKAIFSEGFVGREYCQKMLFGTFVRTENSFDSTTKDFVGTGTDSDGIFVCEVYK